MNIPVREQLARRTEVVRRIQELIIRELYLDVETGDLDPDAPLFGSGHGLDSIDAVELLVALETEFGAALDGEREDAVSHLRTVNTIADRVLLGEGGRA